MKYKVIQNFIQNKKDIFLLVISGITAYIIASSTDLFELFFDWSRAHEEWNIDEIVSMFVILFFILMILLFRKWRASNKEIIKRKQIEATLKTSKERLRILNKILRHDLTNDIVVINSAMNIYNSTSNQDMLTEIGKRIQKVLESIQYYRNYESFIDSNAELEEVEVSKLLFDLVPDFPELEFDIKGSCKIFADDALRSVFINLISNSIKHGNSSKIDVIITSDKQDCIIQFCNNGKGIPNEIKGKIFDEGFSHGETGHIGVGLYIVKKTIEHYNGSIIVEDDKQNGVVFTIKLKKVIA